MPTTRSRSRSNSRSVSRSRSRRPSNSYSRSRSSRNQLEEALSEEKGLSLTDAMERSVSRQLEERSRSRSSSASSVKSAWEPSEKESERASRRSNSVQRSLAGISADTEAEKIIQMRLRTKEEESKKRTCSKKFPRSWICEAHKHEYDATDASPAGRGYCPQCVAPNVIAQGQSVDGRPAGLYRNDPTRGWVELGEGEFNRDTDYVVDLEKGSDDELAYDYALRRRRQVSDAEDEREELVRSRGSRGSSRYSSYDKRKGVGSAETRMRESRKLAEDLGNLVPTAEFRSLVESLHNQSFLVGALFADNEPKLKEVHDKLVKLVEQSLLYGYQLVDVKRETVEMYKDATAPIREFEQAAKRAVAMGTWNRNRSPEDIVEWLLNHAVTHNLTQNQLKQTINDVFHRDLKDVCVPDATLPCTEKVCNPFTGKPECVSEELLKIREDDKALKDLSEQLKGYSA